MAKTADYDLGPFTFPRGWFVVADSTTVTRTPTNVRYFGEDLVLYRGESGAVVMLDAYCPHMGTHFGKSRTSYLPAQDRLIDGDFIRCPFHGWRFGPDGRCNDIPYFDGPIPDAARVRGWTVVERYGIVFCWHDPEGLAPDMEVPAYLEWDDPQWTRWEGLNHVGDMNTHPIEVFDNNSDVAHLDYVHGGEVLAYENEIDGQILWQRQTSRPRAWNGEGNPMHAAAMSTDVYYSGPGLLVSRYREARMAQLIATTPIDDGSSRLWQAAMRKASGPTVEDVDRDLLRHINETMVKGLSEDAEIWANKRPALQIMQLPTDGPFRQSRVWYSQFFNPRDQAAGIVAKVQGLHSVRGMPSAPRISAG